MYLETREYLFDNAYHYIYRRNLLYRTWNYTFATLSGYDETVRETERTTSVRPLLAEDSISDIDRKLRFAVEMQEPVSICYFVQDSSKDGGSYVTATGRVRKLNSFESSIMLEDGSRVALCDIIGISDAI